MKLALALLAAGTIAAGAAQAQDGMALLTKHGCTACHTIDKKVVGPAYNDVAAFAVLLLVLFIRPHGLFGRPSGESVREH